MSDRRHETRLSCHFDDGETVVTEVRLGPIDPAHPLEVRELPVSVASLRDASDVAERVESSLRTALDGVFAHRAAPANLDAEIRRVVGELRPEVGTPIQRSKFAKFQRSPLADRCIEVLRAYLQAVGSALDRPSIGTSWGVTLPRRTLLRVNVGAWEVMNLQPTRTAFVYLQGTPTDFGPDVDAEVREGFDRVAPCCRARTTLDHLPELLSDPRVAAGARAQVDRCATEQTRIKPDRHSPLVEHLLRP